MQMHDLHSRVADIFIAFNESLNKCAIPDYSPETRDIVVNGVLQMIEKAICPPEDGTPVMDRTRVLAIVQALSVPTLTPRLLTAGTEKALSRLSWTLIERGDPFVLEPVAILCS